MLNLTDKEVTVFGAGKSGAALCRLIRKKGGRPRITDAKPREQWTQETRELVRSEKIPAEAGGHSEDFLKQSEMIVLSPGVSRFLDVFRFADKKGIPVLGEIEFAFQFTAKPVIAVTGSNGKTTVSTLIHRVIEKGGRSSCLCGNIGNPFSANVCLDSEIDVYTLEASSFQTESILEDPGAYQEKGLHLKGFCPHIAVLLNFSQNHLDRHRDLDEYLAAKCRLFRNQQKNDYAVINAEIPGIREKMKGLRSRTVYFFPSEKQNGNLVNPNHLAVLEVAKILGISEETAEDVIRNFPGVEHRLEKVRDIRGVEFINDSKSTTTESCRWALQNASRPVVLICGGRDKNLDFMSLSSLIKDKVREIFIIGEAGGKIETAFKEIVSTHRCPDLEAAVKAARKSAREGECVLLSPMCASFDMFRNFEHRGEEFKRIVMNLTE